MIERQERRKDLTVAELCDLYLAEGTSTKKASTLATDNGRIKRHIKPILGDILVSDVNSSHVNTLLKSVAQGKIPSSTEDNIVEGFHDRQCRCRSSIERIV